jgi:iron-sulfur cluster repair protein YtfE (RIC family)
MKVTVLLRNDHEAVKAMFDKFTKPRTQNGKKELFNEIRRELLIHSQMEQEIFYPALSGTSSTQAAELVAKAEQEHEAIEPNLSRRPNRNTKR